jgi:hypothetical protein
MFMRKWCTIALLLVLLLTQLSSAQNADFDNILFVHHSVGNCLVEWGQLRSTLDQYNIQHDTDLKFWDHHYNYLGLRDPQGNYGYGNYDIPGDNTNPDGFYDLFHQPLDTPPDNAFSRIMLPHLLGSDIITHEIIAFKSCFPASDISSDQMLQDYKDWYLSIRDIMDAHPEKIFIPFTPPANVRSLTTPANAARARLFADWLTSDQYLAGHPNVFVFDFWSILADNNPSSENYNYLRIDYRDDPNDSHPNEAACLAAAPLFVNFTGDAIQAYTDPQPSHTGDLNCNSIAYEISDAVLGMQVLTNRMGLLPDSCIAANGDIDHDGLTLTAGDLSSMINIINSDTLPFISPHLQGDSLIISSISSNPGDTVDIELEISNIDDVQAFQFGLRIYPSDFRILNFAPDPDPLFANLVYSNYDNFSYSFDCIVNQYSETFLPAGRYHIGTLRVAISENTPPQATGTIEFFEDPNLVIYSGLALHSASPSYYRNIIKQAGYIQLSQSFIAGDVNGSGTVNGIDVVYLTNYFKGGAAIPVPILRADANGSCEVNGIDVGYLVNFFKGGAEPLVGDCQTSPARDRQKPGDF